MEDSSNKINGDTKWRYDISMREGQYRDRARELAAEFGYLPYMIERYLALWGEEETRLFLQACEHPVRTSIRVNTLKTDRETLVNRLEAQGVKIEPIEWIEEGLWADFGELSVGARIEHMLGMYFVQTLPSMAVTRALDPKQGETVMDLTAAPGGKTTHIAQLMNNTGMLICIEQDRLRLTALEANIQRCGVTNTVVLRGDARKIKALDIQPDRILLDAPCSGEGLLPVDPSRKTSKTMADIRYCATRQEEMLNVALDVLAPGGTLVYSTCSIAPEENEYVIDNVIRRRKDVKIVTTGIPVGVAGYTAPYNVEMDPSIAMACRFLPHIHHTEGFFICKMIREA